MMMMTMVPSSSLLMLIVILTFSSFSWSLKNVTGFIPITSVIKRGDNHVATVTGDGVNKDSTSMRLSPNVGNMDEKSSLSSFEVVSSKIKLSLEPNNMEPNLYNLPDSLSPIYRPMPLITKAAIIMLSTAITMKSTVCNYLHFITTKSLVWKLFKFAFISMLSTLIVQETFYAPSRIDTPTLVERQWLPSLLSKFSTVSPTIDPQLLSSSSSHSSQESVNNYNFGPIGVHYLSHEPKSESLSSKIGFDCIHFNHGFGASSLSWLPAIPSLTTKLNAKIGIAHDAPGFGFTDRPKTFMRRNSLIPYSSAGSAAIGNSLILKEIQYELGQNSNSDDKMLKRVALFGHSMGCASTLRMALSLPHDIHKVIVLVAPALLGSVPVTMTTTSKSSVLKSSCSDLKEINIKKTMWEVLKYQPIKLRSWLGLFVAALRKVVLDAPLSFILRRFVARPNFWLNGLRLAWGNPNLVTESDALRFQWPSISLGWESGLLAFTRSRLFSICNYPGGEQKLFDDVIKLPNTSVIVVHGTKDPVVPLSMSKQMHERWKSSVSFIELDGQGHDPFEEGVDEFVGRVVDKIKN